VIPRCGGFSLIEAVVSILLGALIVAAAWMGLAQQRRAVENMTRRAESLATMRMARTSLARDVSSAGCCGSVSLDTVVLRVVRGFALPCQLDLAPLDPRSMPVRYIGIRAPNPNKDSIRGLTKHGSWLVMDLVEIGEIGGCDTTDGKRGLLLVGSGGLQTLVYAEVFEAGSYHLVGRALRYRGPGGTRQPLTPENLSTGAGGSRFLDPGQRVQRVRLLLAGDGGPPWVMSLGPGR